jgi:hypothetical protein
MPVHVCVPPVQQLRVAPGVLQVSGVPDPGPVSTLASEVPAFALLGAAFPKGPPPSLLAPLVCVFACWPEHAANKTAAHANPLHRNAFMTSPRSRDFLA